jgi:hypothetical protein
VTRCIPNQFRVNLQYQCGPIAACVFSLKADQWLLAGHFAGYCFLAFVSCFSHHELPNGAAQHLTCLKAEQRTLRSIDP